MKISTNSSAGTSITNHLLKLLFGRAEAHSRSRPLEMRTVDAKWTTLSASLPPSRCVTAETRLLQWYAHQVLIEIYMLPTLDKYILRKIRVMILSIFTVSGDFSVWFAYGFILEFVLKKRSNSKTFMRNILRSIQIDRFIDTPHYDL